jgi:mannose-1-phosphate guanylyltransferase
LKAFVLAAGLGTRMGAITQSMPKCLLPVAGKPLLGRWFDLLARAGVSHALVNTHHLAEPVRAYVASTALPLEVRLAHEPVLLGSAAPCGRTGSSRRARSVSSWSTRTMPDRGPDGTRPRPPHGHRRHPGLFRVPDPQTRGIVELDATGTVVAFTEKPERPKSNLAWAGLLVGTPELLAVIPEQTPCDLGHDVLPRLVGRTRGLEIEGYHRDVGTPESYRQACTDLASLGSAA